MKEPVARAEERLGKGWGQGALGGGYLPVSLKYFRILVIAESVPLCTR